MQPDSLAQSRHSRRRPRPFTPRLRIVSRAESHGETVRFLMDELEARYRIVPSESLADKLVKAFEHLPLDEFDCYAERLSRLSGTDREWQGLLHSLTDRESYFNRRPQLLKAVRQEILPELIRRAASSAAPTLRILSVGCVTGEKVYDLAFLVLEALLEAGHASCRADGGIVVDPGWQVELIGSDVSSQSVEIASAGIYGDHWLGSFQGIHHKSWRYFQEAAHPFWQWVPGASYWQVKPFVKKLVRFQRCERLDEVPAEADCDLVVCRDVLLYLDRQGKLQLQRQLAASLKEGGVLLLSDDDPQLFPEWCRRETSGELPYYRRR